MTLKTFLNEVSKKELIPYKKKELITIKEKRERLKNIYKKLLKGNDNALKFMLKKIDKFPEEYIDYELQINHYKAKKLMDLLKSRKHEFTREEEIKLNNIFKRLAKPAVEIGSTGKSKISSKDYKFAADNINKEVDSLLKTIGKKLTN